MLSNEGEFFNSKLEVLNVDVPRYRSDLPHGVSVMLTDKLYEEVLPRRSEI